MNFALLTAGAGGFYCGSCMRDNALARALIDRGHEATLIPLYTPLSLDEPSVAAEKIFFGGVNVFLQDKWKLFRKTPAFIDRVFEAPWLMNLALKLSGLTNPAELGATTLSVAQGEAGRQKKELGKLIDWLKGQPKPDAIVLPNALLMGLARQLKSEIGTSVLCSLQGEDYFIDCLDDPWRDQVWAELRRRVADVDGFIPVSHYYGGVMRERLEIPLERVRAVHNGIDLSGYGAASSGEVTEPVIGYLARISAEKGLFSLVNAVHELSERGGIPGLRLRIAGTVAPFDRQFNEFIRGQIDQLGLASIVEWVDCPDKTSKIEFLQSLKVLSVPATYGESFGLYVIEALACGVPVVQPDHAAFPELVRATGGGILTPTTSRESLIERAGIDEANIPTALKTVSDPVALADGLKRALTVPEDHRQWREAGLKAASELFSSDCMAGNFLVAARELLDR